MRPFNKKETEQCGECGGSGSDRNSSNKYHIMCGKCYGTGVVKSEAFYMDNDEWLEDIEERLQTLEATGNGKETPMTNRTALTQPELVDVDTRSLAAEYLSGIQFRSSSKMKAVCTDIINLYTDHLAEQGHLRTPPQPIDWEGLKKKPRTKRRPNGNQPHALGKWCEIRGHNAAIDHIKTLVQPEQLPRIEGLPNIQGLDEAILSLVSGEQNIDVITVDCADLTIVSTAAKAYAERQTPPTETEQL